MNPIVGDRSVLALPIPAAEPALGESEVIELSLLLPRWQIEALERAARDCGVTMGTMIRRCLGDLLRHLGQNQS